jgi:hypothetical protein
MAFGGLLQAQDGPLQAGPPQDPEVRAALLRATMLLRIAAYIQPAIPPAPRPAQLRVGVVGDDAASQVLRQQMAGKQFAGRELVVLGITADDALSTDKTATVDLLYIATTIDDAVAVKIVAAHKTSPVPLISERRGFAAAGGTVQLFVKENFLRFEVNVEALKRQGLLADSQLLKMSQRGPR